MNIRWKLTVSLLTALICGAGARAQSGAAYTLPSDAQPASPQASDTGAQPEAQAAQPPAAIDPDDGGIVAGGHEMQVYSSAGHSTTSNSRANVVVNAGVRYGWVITNPWGPSFLRNRFEYAVAIVPVFVDFEPNRTIKGLSFDGFVLKFNLMPHHRIVPYYEISGGALFADKSLPIGAGRVNFMPSAALGMSVPQGKFRWSAEIRYLHISDANLTPHNPGINLIQIRVGFGLFTPPRQRS